MGEIADGMINGEFDCFTGEYLGKPCGYPRTAHGSASWERKSKSNPPNTGTLPVQMGGPQMVGKRVRAYVRISGMLRTAEGEITAFVKDSGYQFVRRSNAGNKVPHTIKFCHIIQIL